MPSSAPDEIKELLRDGSIYKVQHDALDDKTKLHVVINYYVPQEKNVTFRKYNILIEMV
jgi:hypothetical protein